MISPYVRRLRLGAEIRALRAKAGLTADQLHEAMPTAGRPRRGDVGKALRTGAEGGNWLNGGAGKPRNPWRYWRSET